MISPEQRRLLLVSNRLPVTVRLEAGQPVLQSSAGGLATGLRGPHERSGGIWIGWPGNTGRLNEGLRRNLDTELHDRGTFPVYLTNPELKGYYEDFANGVLWPVFHDLIAELPMDIQGWQTYKRVNERFAEAVVANYRAGDLIWVHDYHLLLLPRLIRERLPDARIGFFLHIPFPPPEIFSVIPHSNELIKGLLSADLLGFHCESYAANFIATAGQSAGLNASKSYMSVGDRVVQVGAYPMGIDAEHWQSLAASPSVKKQSRELIADTGGRKIILGIDRLDYTKGLLRRISAIEHFLEQDVSLSERVTFVQIVVPSREGLDSYAGLLRRLNELVGRINATYGNASSAPIRVLHRSLEEDEVAALYSAAEVMLVTPLRDGMNLVAKEFVATRIRQDGVLILSQFAGAANELTEALIVNPYSSDDMVTCMQAALTMSAEDIHRRMKALSDKVFKDNVHNWAAGFLRDLAGADSL